MERLKNPLELYRGEDCVEPFCYYMSNEARRLYHMFPEKPMKPLTREQWRKYDRATKCHIVFKGFKKGEIKVRDHNDCHHTGKYRGTAHTICNLRHKIPHYIPIVFRNLSGYDVDLFIRELGKKFDTGKTVVVAENKEKYISFSTDVVVDSYMDDSGEGKERKIQLRFIDSMRFMASSLDSLTNNLVKDGQKLNGFEDEQYELLIRKGIYPYEYMLS